MRGFAGRALRVLFNRDLQDTEREMLSVLAQGKEKEVRAWRRVAAKRGDAESARRARKAEREAALIREELGDDVAFDALAGR